MKPAKLVRGLFRAWTRSVNASMPYFPCFLSNSTFFGIGIFFLELELWNFQMRLGYNMGKIPCSLSRDFGTRFSFPVGYMGVSLVKIGRRFKKSNGEFIPYRFGREAFTDNMVKICSFLV
jgi:hypothetical protein